LSFTNKWKKAFGDSDQAEQINGSHLIDESGNETILFTMHMSFVEYHFVNVDGNPFHLAKSGESSIVDNCPQTLHPKYKNSR
jgi:hypothetical protein